MHACKEGFYSPYSFELEQNQSLELAKPVCAGEDYEAVICVRAFLDGRILTEVEPRHLAALADRILNAILDKHSIPYEKDFPVEMTKSPLIPVAVLGIATLGALVLNALFNDGSESFPENGKKTCLLFANHTCTIKGFIREEASDF